MCFIIMLFLFLFRISSLLHVSCSFLTIYFVLFSLCFNEAACHIFDNLFFFSCLKHKCMIFSCSEILIVYLQYPITHTHTIRPPPSVHTNPSNARNYHIGFWDDSQFFFFSWIFADAAVLNRFFFFVPVGRTTEPYIYRVFQIRGKTCSSCTCV